MVLPGVPGDAALELGSCPPPGWRWLFTPAAHSSCSCSKSPRTSSKSTTDFAEIKSPLPYLCTCKMGVIIFPCCPVAGEDLSLFLRLRRVNKRERRINIYPESDIGKSICGLSPPPTNFPSYGETLASIWLNHLRSLTNN